MYELLKEYSLIDEVVISSKRDKRGKNYGFVRFRKVLEERVFVVKLENIFINNKKIYVNIPRFQRGKPEVQQQKHC